MGYNSVAVILNDHLHRFEKDGPLGKELASAVRSHGYRDRIDSDFGAGQIISQDHADGYQITVTHGNMGWRVDNAAMDKYLGRFALEQMKDCLERNGFRVTKQRSQKAPSPCPPTSPSYSLTPTADSP